MPLLPIDPASDAGLLPARAARTAAARAAARLARAVGSSSGSPVEISQLRDC
jgi:hypothetical protein